ncbi:Pr6Pr family membrane protein [Pollutibacter soli]|uniref:Pr6Pr family membrane protein n=1 Tax=Pollutibacter soli TaxID=3034157 RepID=UPI0030137417
MRIQQPGAERTILLITAITAWFALGLQFYLSIYTSGKDLTEAITRYFSYFTIWINLVIAVCCAISLMPGSNRMKSFFKKPAAVTAIAVYITAGAIVYHTVLRKIWNPEGINRVADELLHLVVPVLFLMYWLFFTTKSTLKWKHIFLWLIFPFAYLLFALTCGAIDHFYPYPFLDVTINGLNTVLLNCVLMIVSLVISALVFITYGKMEGSSTQKL